MSSPAAPSASPLPPLRYPRLLRALPSYRWWKPLVAVVLAAVYWVVFQTVWSLVFLVIGVFAGTVTLTLDQADLLDTVTKFLSIQATDPLSIVGVVGGVATLLPAVLLACRSVGLRPASVLRSVRFRLRWRWMLLCLLPALLITVVAIAANSFLLPALGDGGALRSPDVPVGTFVVSAIAFVVVTPVQAAAEEFGFRGLVTQAVGSWVRPAWVAILVSTLVFAAAHTQYLGWATLDVAVFGLVAGIVTWRTGGLEAAIALHAVNNTLAFLVLATGAEGSTQGVDTEHPAAGDPFSVLISVVTMGGYLLLVELLVRRRGIQRVLDPLPPVAASLPVAPPPPDPSALRDA